MLKHVTRYTSTPHRTLEWQTHADTMTLCWKHVRNKISCVKSFKAILQIKRCRTKFWKDLLESDKLFTYWNMLCSQTSAFLSFLMRDWKCGEGGETDMTASNMSDGVLYKLYCLPTLDKIWLFHMRELCFFLFLVIPFSLVWSRWDFIGITVTYFMHQLSAIYHLMTVGHFQSNLIKHPVLKMTWALWVLKS